MIRLSILDFEISRTASNRCTHRYYFFSIFFIFLIFIKKTKLGFWYVPIFQYICYYFVKVLCYILTQLIHCLGNKIVYLKHHNQQLLLIVPSEYKNRRLLCKFIRSFSMLSLQTHFFIAKVI